MEAGGEKQEIKDAYTLLSHALKSKVTDGFGIVEQPVAALIRAVSGGGRNKGFAEHMALKLEAGMTITHRRPDRSSGAPGEWLVITPEIMAAELLAYSDWEFDDCGAILNHIPGSVRGEARIEYLGFARLRETIAIPLADLAERFPELKPKPIEMPKPRPKTISLAPLASAKLEKLKDIRGNQLTPYQKGQVRKLRAQGYRVDKLAEQFGVSTAEINLAARS